jgi:hypothetical protein
LFQLDLNDLVMKKTFIFISIILLLSVSFFAQTKSKTIKKSVSTPTPAEVTRPISTPIVETEVAAPVQTPPPPTKKNERPGDQNRGQENEPKKKNQKDPKVTEAKAQKVIYPYVYDFSQPNFVVSHIVIEHDEKGKGTISFEKKEFSGEAITDPIQLTQMTLDKLNKLFETLNFLDSTEDYQSPIRDYGHLGNHIVTLRKDGKERVAKYNWTENKDAKALVDEYRKIGEQYIWYFDISVSRENQPLEAPGLMDRLDSLIKRDEISDPQQMLPFLKDLSNDERIPLIARNHATRIIKDIEKKVQKAEK